MRYLESRGLKSSEIIDRFRLGFANRTLGYRLPAKNRAAGADMRGRLQRLGILRESGHEHFNGSIVIPIFDSTGGVVEMYGRKITPNLREGTPDHLYLPGQHEGVWNEEALIASKDIILCEALIDALTFWVAGFRNVTASYGVNGFTADHRAAFEKHGTERVYIAYDRDDAGEQLRASTLGRTDRHGNRVLPRAVPEGHGRQRIRAQGDTASEEPGRAAEQGRMAGQGTASGAARVRACHHRTAAAPVIEPEPEPVIEHEPEPMPEPAIEAAAKEEIIEETPEPEPSPVALIPAATEENVFSLAADAGAR